MEDAYSFIVDFASIRGQGYFAVFDGHAGKYAAEWCGQHFHEVSDHHCYCPFQHLKAVSLALMQSFISASSRMSPSKSRFSSPRRPQ